MTRKLTLIVAVAGVALLVAGPAAGKGQGPGTPQWEAALDARSQALNEQHGLGTASQGTVDNYVGAMEARSQALNEKHGLGVFAPGARGTNAYERALQLRGEAMNRIWLGRGSVVTSERVTRSEGTPAYETALALRSQELNRQHELGTFAKPYMDAGERALRVQGTETRIIPDAFERAVGSRGTDGFVKGDDFVRVDPSNLPTVVVEATPTSTGTEVEWPQIGIGFLIGLLLTIGIALTIRFNRETPLAH
jgi:hypothetical protein